MLDDVPPCEQDGSISCLTHAVQQPMGLLCEGSSVAHHDCLHTHTVWLILNMKYLMLSSARVTERTVQLADV